MTKRFDNFPDLCSELAFDLKDRLEADARLSVQFGASNQSCSRYVNIDVLDDDDDYVDDAEFKVRFSDHDDRHGSDITIRIDDLITTITDDDDEYVAVEIAEDDYQAALAQAEAAVAAHIGKVL